jgi:quinol monooxygenase YgiN
VARDLEAGDTLRFDVWDVPNEPDAVYLYEAYRDVESFWKHQSHEPYKQFVQQVEPELLRDKYVFSDGAQSRISVADSP